MGTSVSLPGPLGTSIALQYGATGIPTVIVTDPAFPRGGYSGPLNAGSITSGINDFQSQIIGYNRNIYEAQNNIKNASQLVPPAAVNSYIASQQADIKLYTDARNSANNSIQEATYLLNNLANLTAKLATANATAPNTNTSSSTPAPNQKPITAAIAAAPAPAPKTTTKPATTTPPAPLAIPNPVPNPKLKPPTDATAKTLITPTPTTKVSQPALIPAPKPVAPTITNPFAKTAPGPNAIVTTVPNPKLSTKTKVPLIVTSPPNPVTIKTPTEAIAGGGGSFGGGGASGSWAKQPAPVTDPKGAPLPLSTFAFTPPTSPASGITGDKAATAVKPTQQDQVNFEARKDWRVRLALAPDGPTTKYMYRADFPGILEPLRATDGVVFPYTPSISVNYAATYEPTSPVHSNYKINQYTSSSVDQVNITCDFTAQDVAEANYLLAVIHFFRSMTKMFYGQDDIPKNGTPPPLCYLFGLGEFQFSALPLAITGFSYSLPNDVDYIKTTGASPAGSPQPAIKNAANTPARLGANITAGGKKPSTNYGATPSSAGVAPTYVPTKIQLAITCIPMMSRNMVSNKFSLKEYANGNLLKGTVNPGGGMW